MFADLALLNGNIITMNSKSPKAEAIAVKDDIIIKVGTNYEINQTIIDTTEVIQLKGKTVIPGLIDTHIHVADYGRLLMWIDLTSSRSLEDLQNSLKKKVKTTSPERWIAGRGWDEKFFSKEELTRYNLDSIAPDNPVVFYDKSGKISLVNSKAIELSKILQYKKKYSEDEILENPDTREVTGIIKGKAMERIWSTIPEPQEEDLLELAKLACLKIIESGISSVHWMVLSPIELSIIKKLRKSDLPLRIYVIIPFELWKSYLKKKSYTILKKNLTEIGAVEVSVDGYLANKTAALFDPYLDKTESIGELLYSQECLNSNVIDVLSSGLQVILRAVGDRAIKHALDSIEKALEKYPNLDSRIRLEQAALLNEDLLNSIEKYKLLVSIQPCVINSEFKIWSALEKLGKKRAAWLFPLRTLKNRNVFLLGGSDCPMEPLNPFLGIQMSVNRLFFSQESLRTNEALAMYTINAAYSTKEENSKGSIEEGKLADLTILSKDPTNIPKNEIRDIEIIKTIIGGRIVYNK